MLIESKFFLLLLSLSIMLKEMKKYRNEIKHTLERMLDDTLQTNAEKEEKKMMVKSSFLA